MISTITQYEHIYQTLTSNYLQFDSKPIKLHAKLSANIQNNYISTTKNNNCLVIFKQLLTTNEKERKFIFKLLKMRSIICTVYKIPIIIIIIIIKWTFV